MEKKLTPAQFIREVRQELKRVCWPTRKEIMTTSFMVFLMTIVTALFFLFVDTIISIFINFILGG
jgi:preprotein translocase subunit SecE